MARLVLQAVTASAAILCGCSEASGQLRGGEALEIDPCADADATATWTDLYGCYFGPTGKASCAALTGECHGSRSDTGGAYGANGFVCGHTQEACYEGFTTYSIDGGAASVELIEMQLRTASSAAGTMPCNPLVVAGALECSASTGNAYTFTAEDIARLDGWIDAGAPNN